MSADLQTITRNYLNIATDKDRPEWSDYVRQQDPALADQLAQEEREREERERALREWQPTQDDILAHFREQGWPVFEDFKSDHLETDGEREKLQTAVNSAGQFVNEVKDGKRLALIMIASEVPEDLSRTGYGCGKTMLARTIYHANYGYSAYYGPDSLRIHPRGRFLEARELMAIFDKDDYSPRDSFAFGSLLVIDDVGREGSLRWERRDPELQAAEKQSRYYNVINHCYEKGISIVITSNLPSRGLAELLGGASWSRLLQMCPTRYRLNMTGIMDMRPLLADEYGDDYGFGE